MARRSDHTPEELKLLAIVAGKNILAQVGFNKFSARKVAKEIGYSIGTIYNIFESHDHFILCINATTLDEMNEYLQKNMTNFNDFRGILKSLASSYIHFANENYHRWSALFEHSLPKEIVLPEWYALKMKELYGLVEKPLILVFENNQKRAEEIAQILWASVHGICQLGLTGKLYNNGLDMILNLANDFIENYINGILSEK